MSLRCLKINKELYLMSFTKVQLLEHLPNSNNYVVKVYFLANNYLIYG